MRKFLIVPVIIAAISFTIQAEETKFDPTRPVSMLGQTEFTLQWSTPEPCQTKFKLEKAETLATPGSRKARNTSPGSKKARPSKPQRHQPTTASR